MKPLKGLASLPGRLGSRGSSFLAKPSRLLHAGVALSVTAGLIWTYAGSGKIEAPDTAAATTAADTTAPATAAAAVPSEQQSTPSATEAATKTEPASTAAPAQTSDAKSADAQTVGAKPAETKPTESPAASAQQEPAKLTTPQVAALPSFQDTRPIAQTATAQPPAAPAPAAAAPGAMFHDARPLQAAGTQTVASQAPAGAPATPPKPGTSLTFRDTRPISNTPLFQDRRPVEVPSFQDKRPVALPSFQVPPVTALAPATEPAARSAPVANTTDVTKPSLVAVAPPPLKIDAGACGAPEITTEALDGGMMALHITAACHPNETVQISYAGAEFLRKLNAWGALDFTLDCFAGTSSAVDVRFGDNTRKTVPVAARDLDQVSKIAILWRAPVNLDLHVFEYAARHDQAGHLWAKKPSAIATARLASQTEKRGHGFLSAVDDDQSLGDKIEVYTFLHNDEQASGSIALALDYETRGETPAGATCGQGALAEIDFQVVIQPRGGQVSRQAGVLTRVECGIRIATESRFNQAALPGLRIRR